MRQKPQNPNIDRAWFLARMEERDLTVRGLAKIMKRDPSTISLMLRGIRKISTDEAVMLAELFNVKSPEILRRAGAPLVDETRTIPVAAYIDESHKVYDIPAEAEDFFTAPFDVPTSAFAVQSRNGRMTDGWIAVVNGIKREPDDCVGHYCMFCESDGTRRMGWLKRGYKSGHFNAAVGAMDSSENFENITVIWASEVLWVKPTGLL